MNTDIVFEQADKLRTLKNKDEIIDFLSNFLPAELKQLVDKWKNKDLDQIREELKEELVEKLRAKIPDKYQFLLDPVNKLDDKIFDLVDISKEADTGGVIKVAGALAASIELDGVLDSDLSETLQSPIPDGSVLFTASVRGKIGINATGTGGTPLVSLSGKFSSDHEQTLTVGFIRDEDQLVIIELLRLRDYFVNPADLTAVMDSFADKSARLIQHEYKGTVVFGLEIGIKKDLEAALEKLIPSSSVTPSGSVGASFTVNFKDEDEFVLSVERDTASSAWVRLKKKKTQERTRVFKLGATIEIKGLKDQILNRIGELLPEENKVSKAIAKLDELIDQVDGDNLTKLVQGKLKDKWPDHASVFDVFLGYTTTAEIADQIVKDLTESITDKINDNVNVLSDDASDKATSIAREILAELGFGSEASARVQDYLANAIQSAIEDFRTRANDKIAEVNESASDRLKEILKPFKNVSDKVSKAFDKVGDTSQDALEKIKAGIEEIYSNYTEFRQKLISVIKEKVSEQATFALVSESKQTVTDTTLITFRILDAEADGVADLYRAIWSRRLDNLWKLLPKFKSNPGISQLKGSYVSILENQKKLTFALDLFGLKISTESLFKNKVKVGIDDEGKLIAAETEAEYKTQRKLGKESQLLVAEWTIDYMAEDAGLSPPVKITMGISDEEFDEGDLETFFESLTRLDLVKPDTYDEVAKVLFGAVRKVKDVSLRIMIPLNWEMLQDLLGTTRKSLKTRPGRWIPDEIQDQLYEAVTKANPDFFKKLERFAARQGGQDPQAILLSVGRERNRTQAKQNWPSAIVGYYKTGQSLNRLDDNLEKLQTSWSDTVTNFEVTGLAPATVKKYQKMISKIDGGIHSVLSDLFLRSAMATVSDLSNVWRLSAAARVILTQTERKHVLVSVESPKLGRLIFG